MNSNKPISNQKHPTTLTLYKNYGDEMYKLCEVVKQGSEKCYSPIETMRAVILTERCRISVSTPWCGGKSKVVVYTQDFHHENVTGKITNLNDFTEARTADEYHKHYSAKGMTVVDHQVIYLIYVSPFAQNPVKEIGRLDISPVRAKQTDGWHQLLREEYSAGADIRNYLTEIKVGYKERSNGYTFYPTFNTLRELTANEKQGIQPYIKLCSEMIRQQDDRMKNHTAEPVRLRSPLPAANRLQSNTDLQSTSLNGFSFS